MWLIEPWYMITIIVDYKSVEDKTISQVHFSGHAGYADIGHDIICSAVSVLLLTAINSIEEIVGINNFYRILEGSDNEVNVYPHSKMEDVLVYCKKNNLTLVEYILKFEKSDILEYMKTVLKTMEECINRGIYAEGVLPGRLSIERKASSFYQKFLMNKKTNELVYAYSLAVSEENASCNVIVTAPTCGASAVVPAVLFSQKVLNNKTDEELINALLIGGLIGNIVKNNASISGAEVGCQGEVGVACSMASALLVYLLGGDNETSEYAAEIALEHHLGLTCDPIDGLVQIPCIERNAISALAAYNIAEYAILAGPKHTVTLDSVIEVMKKTEQDLKEEYRETSTGGLALHNK